MKEINAEEIYDLWLKKYHNITIKEVMAKYPEEIKSPKWFELFPCTQQQSDDWEKECKKLLNKKYKYPKSYIERAWWSVYLNFSPYVKPEENER